MGHLISSLTKEGDNASVNSTCAQHRPPQTPHPPPPPRRATSGHLPAMSVLGVGRLQILHCPGPFPSWVQMEWTDA